MHTQSVWQPRSWTNLNHNRASRAAGLVLALTLRQRQVLAGMIDGFRNKQIAASLGIDEKTVKMHRARVLSRLGVATSAQAIRIGVEATFAAPERKSAGTGVGQIWEPCAMGS